MIKPITGCVAIMFCTAFTFTQAPKAFNFIKVLKQPADIKKRPAPNLNAFTPGWYQQPGVIQNR